LAGADHLKLAEAFLEEARCDLERADILIATIKPRVEESVRRGEADDVVFCRGRRILFLLQQATEKLIKAYALVYIAPMEERLKKHGIRLKTQIDAKKMGHAPHDKLVRLLEEIVENRGSIMAIISGSAGVFERAFNELSKLFPDERGRIEAFKEAFMNTAYRPLVDDFSRTLGEFKWKYMLKKEPLCLDGLAVLESMRGKLEEALQEALKRFRDATEKLNPHQDLLRSLVEKTKMGERDRRGIEILLQILFGEEGERALRVILSQVYIFAFVIASSCISWYVDGGRYPDVGGDEGKIVLAAEMRDPIWSDIKNIEGFRRELELLARVVEEGVKHAPLLAENTMLLLHDALTHG
jgi:hypothetical protein